MWHSSCIQRETRLDYLCELLARLMNKGPEKTLNAGAGRVPGHGKRQCSHGASVGMFGTFREAI